MMQFIKPNTNIDFVGLRKYAYGASLTLIIASLVFLAVIGGPKKGIDFSGGTMVQVKFAGPVQIPDIKSGLAGANIKDPTVQNFGAAENNEYLIRTPESGTDADSHSDLIVSALTAATGVTAEVRQVDSVGPQVGKDLRNKALFAIFYTLLLVGVYISGRFETKWISSGIIVAAMLLLVYLVSMFKLPPLVLVCAGLAITLFLFWVLDLKYAMGAIVALIHDVIITVGIFSFVGGEFNLPIIAALLTIVGYSLNDTIIVFDRIRENIRRQNKSPFGTIINNSVNETLSRTVITSGVTLLAVIALYVWGGGVLHDFAFTMLIGIVVGTYSSIYVASPILLAWEKKGKK